MADIAKLVVQLVADITGYQGSLDKAAADAKGFASKVGGGLAAVGGAIVTGSIIAAGAAVAGMGMYLKSAVEEASRAEEVASQLNNTLANTGSVTGVTSGMVAQLAQKYQSLTRYEDDTVMSGGEVLARFTQINSSVFPDALRLSLDLATRWKTDVPTAAATLGKALADPGVGLLRLKTAGVVFTDAQDAMIKKMVEAGDAAGAQAIILDVVNKTAGGAAEAAGKTAAGSWERLRNIWGNTSEMVGAGLLPALTKLGNMLGTYLARPEVQAFFVALADKIGAFAAQVVAWLPQVVTWFQAAFGWLMENKGVIVGALAGIGVAVIAFAVSAGAAIWAAMAPLLPVIAIMLAVAGIAYLIYQAWTKNWGGIQEKTAIVMGAIKAAVEWGMTYIRHIIAAVTALIHGDWREFGTQLRAIWDMIWGPGGLLSNALKGAWNWMKGIIGTLIVNVVNFFTKTNWKKVGADIVQGIANGIRAGAQWAVDAIWALAKSMMDAIKRFFGIESPSKLMKLAGQNVVMGFALGMEDMTRQLMPRMAGVMSGVAMPMMGMRGAPAYAGAGGESGQIILNNYGTIQLTPGSADSKRSLLRQLGRP